MAHMGIDSVIWNSPRQPNSSAIMRWRFIATELPPIAPNSSFPNLSLVSVAETGVPWFRKIPVFGWLFKNQEISQDNRELLIFITPKILRLS